MEKKSFNDIPKWGLNTKSQIVVPSIYKNKGILVETNQGI
jgi:hypothetical protein